MHCWPRSAAGIITILFPPHDHSALLACLRLGSRHIHNLVVLNLSRNATQKSPAVHLPHTLALTSIIDGIIPARTELQLWFIYDKPSHRTRAHTTTTTPIGCTTCMELAPPCPTCGSSLSTTPAA